MVNDIQYQPNVPENQAKDILEDLYGIKSSLSSLASERDQNFRVTTQSNADQYVLRIANLNADREQIELENSVMSFLQNSPVAEIIPRVQASLNEKTIETVHAEGGEFLIRLVQFLPGRVLASVRPPTPQLLENLGSVLGQFTAAMTGFDVPSSVKESRNDFFWNLDRFESTQAELREALPQESMPNIDLLNEFIAQYLARVLPKLETLRKSLIQNDANDHNVIVSPAIQWPQTITGLIDFGDMAYASTINELAIAIAYVMLEKSDPLIAAASVVKGFHSAFNLEETELEILFDLACARLCTSVLMAAHQRALNPENEYLSVTDQPAQKLLSQLQSIHPDYAAATFRGACGLVPMKQSVGICKWLENNASNFSPLLGQKLTTDNTCLLDLSVSSIEPFAGDLGSKAPELIEGYLKSRSKSVGIGRYLEPRTCYQGDQFNDGDSGDDPAIRPYDYRPTEPRTIHMGVDLFAAAGTPVFSPCSGRIHSFADNDIPFDYGPTIIVEHDSPGGRFLTLYGHLDRESLNTLEIGQPVSTGQLLARIGSQSVNGGWAPHLHFQVMSDDLGLKENYPGVVKASDLEIWKSIILDPYTLAGVPQEVLSPLESDLQQLQTDRQEFLNPSLSLSYDEPIHMVRGRGQFLFDRFGHRYLDCVNNVCHVGHCHEKVVQVATNQLGLLNTNTRYLHNAIVEYAKQLVTKLPEELDTCFFVNSGSEANDLALRLARNFTGKQEVVCVEGAYHGHVTSLIEISPYKYDSAGGKGKPEHVYEIPMPNLYRGEHQLQDDPVDDPGKFYSEFVRQTIADSEAKSPDKGVHQIAAFICESILSCGGQVVLPERFLSNAYEHCRNAGVLCIADEVQVGFGRVGEAFWGFELQNVVPDIVTMGKPIGNGFPLGAVVTRREIADAFNNGMEYFNTYGGNPVACSVGLSVLEVVENEQLQHNAHNIGSHLLTELKALQSKHHSIGDVRGKGLFIGIEFVIDRDCKTPAPELAEYVVERMKNFGILLSTDGPKRNVIKIKPPLCFDQGNVMQLVSALDRVLNEDFVKA